MEDTGNFKCENCGFVGDPEYGEEKETGFMWDYCPQCGGDMYPSYRCIECGEQFIRKEKEDFFCLFPDAGLCRECVFESLNFETGYNYLIKQGLVDSFVDFFVDEDAPFVIKKAFAEWLEKSDKKEEKNNIIIKEMFVEYLEDSIDSFAEYIATVEGGEKE